MLRSWKEPREISIPEEFVNTIGGNSLVSQVLISRGIRDIQAAKGFLNANEYHPSPAREIPGVDQAVDLILKAVSENKRIGIWGDFDVDGQTSTTILVSSLRELGGNVIYHIPIRAEESHGIHLPALEKFLRLGVDLIVTCDTGISSQDAIDYAKIQQVPVIITDHHDLPESLPKAAAILNPKMLPSEHPLSTLPGAAVAYKLTEELWHAKGMLDKASQNLDLVALGIVADIALLRADTRYLLQLGLEGLRHTTRPGLQAMMKITELNQSNITEEHIGFILAPRMNAIGRLEDANSMVELLTTKDEGKASVLALELERMNAQRKLLTDQVYQAAQSQILTIPSLLDFPVLVLSHTSWPAGVIGLVASKLVEQYNRPVILIAAPTGEVARGSARSIEGINITAAISANKSMLKGFGGHPMAAGLAIEPDRIREFQQAISRTIQEMGVSVQKEKQLQIDGYLTLPELSLDLVEDLERLAPFGAGNPPLILATRNLKLTGYAAVGRSGEHLQITIEDELGHEMPSIWWQGAGFPLPEARFDLAYTVRASTYRGQRDIQIEWIDYRINEAEAILEEQKRPIEVIDMRGQDDPIIILKKLQEAEELLVWGEAEAKLQIDCLDRLSLFPGKNLVIWTIPPGPDEIRVALEKTKPRKIYLFAINPGMDDPTSFLSRLIGLLKNRLRNYGGITTVSGLAAATAQHPSTVLAGLDWLEEQGYVHVSLLKGDELRFIIGNKAHKSTSRVTSTRLNSILAETSAYRRYYLSADKERLITFKDKS
jgi:single-stranded-DNA-specific exonuclease